MDKLNDPMLELRLENKDLKKNAEQDYEQIKKLQHRIKILEGKLRLAWVERDSLMKVKNR